jgi:hypothetical protein
VETAFSSLRPTRSLVSPNRELGMITRIDVATLATFEGGMGRGEMNTDLIGSESGSERQ